MAIALACKALKEQNVKKKFGAKRFRKYCTIKCRKKQIVKTRNQRQKENLQYPNANEVDKIILDHDIVQ